MKVNELLDHWQQDTPTDDQQTLLSAKLPVVDAARLNALADMYPQRSQSQIISDLISNALSDLQTQIPQLRNRTTDKH